MNKWAGAFDSDTRYRGDALVLMPKIPDGAIKLIVTDPPLQSTLMHNGRRGISAGLKSFSNIFSLHVNIFFQMQKIAQKRVK